MNQKRILDDVTLAVSSGASVLRGAKEGLRRDVRSRIDELALRLDLVPRADFERLEQLVDTLEQRIAALENNTKNSKKDTKNKAKK